MIARCVCTLALLILAFFAFWGDALDAGRVFNPIGLLFLFLAAVAWHKWEIVRGAYGSAKNESNIPILRMGYKVLEGFGAKTPADEAPPERSSSSR